MATASRSSVLLLCTFLEPRISSLRTTCVESHFPAPGTFYQVSIRLTTAQIMQIVKPCVIRENGLAEIKKGSVPLGPRAPQERQCRTVCGERMITAIREVAWKERGREWQNRHLMRCSPYTQSYMARVGQQSDDSRLAAARERQTRLIDAQTAISGQRKSFGQIRRWRRSSIESDSVRVASSSSEALDACLYSFRRARSSRSVPTDSRRDACCFKRQCRASRGEFRLASPLLAARQVHPIKQHN